MRGMTRRGLLAGGGAALLLAAVAPVRAAAPEGHVAWLACAKTAGGTYQAVGLTAAGQVAFALDLPGRGHGAAVSPEGARAVIFARRPARFARVVDVARGAPVGLFETPPDRHFAGHGFFTADGAYLYATENDFDGERGVIGIYDARRAFRRVGELESHGIGPHEAILLADGRTIAVANGGIQTHPEFPRAKLNIAEMRPSLAFIDARGGRLLARAEPPAAWHKLSIRHLAEDASGRVWLGCQYEGATGDRLPLIGRAAPGGEIDWLALEPGIYRALQHYVGSLAAFDGGRRIAFTSPVGGRLAVCDAASGALLVDAARPDICGLAADGAALIAADGAGNLWRGTDPLARHPALAWDNHMTALPV